MNTYTVGELASMAGITVRTLHHYDEIGLLVPTGRTPAGYRSYDDSAVDRLRTILTYRELGLGLDEIATTVDDDTLAETVLRHARDRIVERIARLEAISASLDRAIDERTVGGTMTPEEKLSVFGGFDPDDHIDEVSDRWGDSAEFADATRRTARYTQSEWDTINAELADIYQRLLSLRDAGIPATSPASGALVEEHRAHISRWYYECTPQVHEGLGQMYSTDPRFGRNIDRAGEGLATYLSEAIPAHYR